MMFTETDFDSHVTTYRGFLRGLRFAVAIAALTLVLLAATLL